jgi:hypothetical protein
VRHLFHIALILILIFTLLDLIRPDADNAIPDRQAAFSPPAL